MALVKVDAEEAHGNNFVSSREARKQSQIVRFSEPKLLTPTPQQY